MQMRLSDAAMWDGAGWDSELTDLSDSAGEEPPRPSFKIRIPARTPTKHSLSPASTSTPTKRAGDPTATPTTPGLSTSLPTPPASAEVQRFCTITRCRVPLPPHSLYRWKCCSSCRKQYREYARDRLARVAAANAATASAPTPAPKAKPPTPTGPKTLPAHIEALRAHTAQKEWQREENRRALALAGVPVKARREPPPPPPPPPPVTWSVAPGVQQKRAQRQVPGARVCAGRTCDHIIPAEDEYEWTMCGVCHAREQRKAERMDGKSPTKGKGAEKDDMPIAAVRKPGRCRYADCGTLMPVDAEVSVAECEQCVRRKLQRKTPGRPLGSRNKPKGSAKAGPLATRKPQTAASPEKPLEAPRKRKRVSPYPSYQCRDALLADFGTRFHGFIEAQSYHFLMRGGMAHTQPPAQAMFDFSGEYSVIAADLDIVGRKGTVEVGVHGVKDAVARAGGLEFSPTSWVSILGNPGGIVTRFACVHLVTMFLPIRVPPGHPPNPALPKTMQGELEIAVLPDESHKYFAGEKTIVRFRLVG
ncbi:hypothetical protein B0H11DRAFT_2228150 [Mycena galericulata]|nr:hypothetical protein B0H11DRAFT_2228150 [Mycena galericulata]